MTTRGPIIAGLVFAFLTYLWIAVLHDESLDPGFDSFLNSHGAKVAPNQDAAIGLMGLLAPPGADMFKHGLLMADLANEAVSPEKGRERRLAAGEVAFERDRAELECWISPNPASASTSCASPARVTALLAENKDLIDRYRQLYSLTHFGGFSINGDVFLYLNWLLFAEIDLDLKNGDNETAYLKWQANHRFLLDAIAGHGTWVDRAILSVALSGSLSAAESLLHTAPELIKAHRSQLAELFAPKWVNDWNLEKVFASELSLRESLFKIGDRPPWVHPNFIRNRSLRFSRKIIEAVSEANGDVLLQKLKNISEAHVSVSAWTPDYVRDPFNTWFVRKLVINEIFPIGLVNSMIQLAGRTRLIALRMMIEQNDIPDQSVPDFLASVQNNLRNPFTGEPMRWSKEHRVIWFDQPEGTSTPIPHQVRLAGGHWLDK